MQYIYFFKEEEASLNTDTRFGGGLDHMKHFGSTITVKYPNYSYFDEGFEFKDLN